MRTLALAVLALAAPVVLGGEAAPQPAQVACPAEMVYLTKRQAQEIEAEYQRMRGELVRASVILQRAADIVEALAKERDEAIQRSGCT